MAGETRSRKNLESRIEALEKENAVLRLFKFGIDMMPNSRFAIGNRDYRFEAVSKGYVEALHQRGDEIVGKSAVEVLGEKMFYTIVKPNFDKALEGETINFSTWFELPGSSRRFLNIQYYPVPARGEINRVAILIHDLTRVKQAEEALTLSDENCRKAQQIAHIGSWHWNAAEDRIIYSDEFCFTLGIRPEEFFPTYEGYLQFVHPEDIGIFKYFESALSMEKTPYSKKYRIVRPDGGIRMVHEQGEATLDPAGSPVRSFGTIQDITEQIQAEEQYRAILQTAIDGFCIADRQGRLLEVNESYCRMLGYSREELLNLGFSDIDAEKTVEEMDREYVRVIAEKRCYIETKHRRKDGTLINVEISVQYSGIKHGVFVCFIRDITEIKKSSEALKRQELRYRELFEGAPMMYVIIKDDEEKPVVLDCNRHFLSVLGYSREEVIGKIISDFYTPESKKKMMAEQNSKKLKERAHIVSDRDLVTRDGRIINALIQGDPEYDEGGNIIGARCMYIDITSQKKSEDQLRESHELLLMIVDGISDPLIMVDKNMYLVMMNKAAEQYFHKNNEDCLARQCHEIFKNYPAPCEGCMVPSAIRHSRKEVFERKGLMNPEDLERVSIYPVLEKDAGLWAVIIRISDITKIRQMEAELIQADKMISLGILVSGVAHEINNPNNFIMLNTPVLWDAWKSVVPVIEKYYKENGDFSLSGLPYSLMREEIPLLFSGIKDGAVRIQRIVRDLKNFARQDNSDMTQDVNINQVIKNSVQMTENLIKAKTKHFRVEYGSHLPMIRGNEQKLEQVMINLIQNACQAIPDMEKGLFITSFFKKTGEIVIQVRDEGVGIPENLLDRIMDPFFTTKRDVGGTGLGLAVSSTIIKAHNGKIEVSSEPGRGSVFRVLIPAILVNE
nr:PAS domain S-box protein [Desulfobacula sp.]